MTSEKARDKYQLNPHKSQNYVEFDVDTDRLEWVRNPLYGTPELTVRGDVEIENPEFFKRKK